MQILKHNHHYYYVFASILLMLSVSFIVTFFVATLNEGVSEWFSVAFFISWLRRFLLVIGFWLIVELFSLDLPKFVRSLIVGACIVLFYIITKKLGVVSYSDNLMTTTARFALSLIVVFSTQYALKYSIHYNRLAVEQEKNQKQIYQTQLQSLRSKIDPHFLFNALNTLRSMMEHNRRDSKAFVIHLSEFYRHTLNYNDDVTLFLKDEIAVLQSYFFVMQCRYPDKLNMNIDISERCLNQKLPALALQVAVENCFKHNISSQNKRLFVDILTDKSGYIVIKNNLQLKLTTQPTSGYGLDNIRQQYALLGVDKGVIIDSDDEYFIIRFKLLS